MPDYKQERPTFGAKLAAARDVVRATSSVEAFTGTQSAFMRPVVARSLCLMRAYPMDDPASLCAQVCNGYGAPPSATPRTPLLSGRLPGCRNIEWAC